MYRRSRRASVIARSVELGADKWESMQNIIWESTPNITNGLNVLGLRFSHFWILHFLLLFLLFFLFSSLFPFCNSLKTLHKYGVKAITCAKKTSLQIRKCVVLHEQIVLHDRGYNGW